MGTAEDADADADEEDDDDAAEGFDRTRVLLRMSSSAAAPCASVFGGVAVVAAELEAVAAAAAGCDGASDSCAESACLVPSDSSGITTSCTISEGK